jgi:hypothetical protein
MAERVGDVFVGRRCAAGHAARLSASPTKRRSWLAAHATLGCVAIPSQVERVPRGASDRQGPLLNVRTARWPVTIACTRSPGREAAVGRPGEVSIPRFAVGACWAGGQPRGRGRHRQRHVRSACGAAGPARSGCAVPWDVHGERRGPEPYSSGSHERRPGAGAGPVLQRQRPSASP